jgi:hypothetical protein
LGSNLKQRIDEWYDTNVKNTLFEQYVQPVVLANPTLGDMIDMGILKSNTENEDYNNFWRSHDAKYRTRVDATSGVKQAFVLSSADVASGVQYGASTALTPEAITWKNGFDVVWFRSPGANYESSAGVYSGMNHVVSGDASANVTNFHSVVPSLVVHIK